MKLDIDELEAKLIKRYGKDGWEKRLNDFIKKYPNNTYEGARRTVVLALSKIIAASTPSRIIKE